MEAVSGASVGRPVLEECLAELAVGDTLVVWRLDRLGRSAQHLLGILEQLRERGVAFRSVTEGMDTSTYMGRFVFTVLAALAVISSSPDDQGLELGCNVADGVFDLAA